jgi:hypothetical protein
MAASTPTGLGAGAAFGLGIAGALVLASGEGMGRRIMSAGVAVLLSMREVPFSAARGTPGRDGR